MNKFLPIEEGNSTGRETFCERCGRRLQSFVALELDSHTGKYHESGTVPSVKSQGHFVFGSACAKKVNNGPHPESRSQ